MTKIKQRIYVVLALILSFVTLLAGTFLFIGKNSQYADAYSDKPTPTVTLKGIGTLGSDPDFDYIDKSGVDELYRQLLGPEATYDDILEAARSTGSFSDRNKLRYEDFRAINNNQDIIIEMGGFYWAPVFLSVADGDTPILTLYQCYSDKKTTWLPGEGKYSFSDDAEYPMVLYSNSYIRSFINGYDAAYSEESEHGSLSYDGDADYVKFKNEFYNFLLPATAVNWQRDLNYYSEISDVDLNGDYYSHWGGYLNLLCERNNTLTQWNKEIDEHQRDFYTLNDSLFENINYTNWGYDTLWLPSSKELGYGDSIDTLWGNTYNITDTNSENGICLRDVQVIWNEVEVSVANASTPTTIDNEAHSSWAQNLEFEVRVACHLDLSRLNTDSRYTVEKPSLTTQSFGYDGKDKTIELNDLPDGLEFYVGEERNESFYENTFSAKNAGVHELYAIPSYDQNYVWKDYILGGSSPDDGPMVSVKIAEITITPKPITLQISDRTQTYGNSPSSLYAYDSQGGAGFAEGEDESDIPGISSAIKFDNGRSTLSSRTPIGTYNLTAPTSVMGNYNVTFLSGTYKVEPRPITLSIVSVTKTYGDDPAQLEIDMTPKNGTSFPFSDENLTTLYGSDAQTVLNNKILFNGAATKPDYKTAVGTYRLTTAQPTEDKGNYKITFTSGTYEVKPRTLKVKWTQNPSAPNWKTFNPSATSEIYYDGSHPMFSTLASANTIDATFALDIDSSIPAGINEYIKNEASALGIKVSDNCSRKDVDGIEHSTSVLFVDDIKNYVLDSETATIKYNIIARPVTVKIGNLVESSGTQYGSDQAALNKSSLITILMSDGSMGFVSGDGDMANFVLSCEVTSASVPGYYPITCTFEPRDAATKEQIKKNYKITFTGDFGSPAYQNTTYSQSNNVAGVYQVRNATIEADGSATSWQPNNAQGTIQMTFFHDQQGEKRSFETSWFKTKNGKTVTLEYAEGFEGGSWASTIEDALEPATYEYRVRVSAEYHDTREYKVTFVVSSERVTVTFKSDNLAQAQYGAALPQEDELWALVDSVTGLHFENEDLEGQNAIDKLKEVIDLYLTDGHSELTAAEAVAGSYAIAFRFVKTGETANYHIELVNQTEKYTVTPRELTMENVDWGHLESIDFKMVYGDETDETTHAQHHPNPALKNTITQSASASSLPRNLTFEIWHKDGAKIEGEHAHNAGTYTVKITGLPAGWDKMYKLPEATIEKDIEITAKEISVSITKAMSTAYHAQSLAEMTATLNDHLIQYLTAHEGLLSADYDEIKLTVEYTGEGYETPETCYPNVGTLTIKGEATGTAVSNYKINWTNGTWKITQATNTLSGEYKRDDWIEHSPASAVTNTLSAAFGEITLKYYTDADFSTEYKGAFDENTPKGTYYVKAYVEGTENYTAIDRQVATFTVSDHIEHDWQIDTASGENGWTWTWDGEHNTYTVTLTFKCNVGLEEEKRTETAEVAVDDSGAATCTQAGELKYTATVNFESQAYTSEKTIAQAALGHNYDANIWESDETSHWNKCSRCGEELNKHDHDFDDGVITTPPTETEAGVKMFTCDVCGKQKTESVAPAGTGSGSEGSGSEGSGSEGSGDSGNEGSGNEGSGGSGNTGDNNNPSNPDNPSGGTGDSGAGSGNNGSANDGSLDGGDVGPLVVVVAVEAVMLAALIAAVVVLRKR